jgi:hypothetical protein
MDDETRDLVIRLCTRAGMMMEDVSPVAILMPRDDEATSLAIARIVADVATICRLVDAAERLASDRES